MNKKIVFSIAIFLTGFSLASEKSAQPNQKQQLASIFPILKDFPPQGKYFEMKLITDKKLLKKCKVLKNKDDARKHIDSPISKSSSLSASKARIGNCSSQVIISWDIPDVSEEVNQVSKDITSWKEDMQKKGVILINLGQRDARLGFYSLNYKGKYYFMEDHIGVGYDRKISIQQE